MEIITISNNTTIHKVNKKKYKQKKTNKKNQKTNKPQNPPWYKVLFIPSSITS